MTANLQHRAAALLLAGLVAVAPALFAAANPIDVKRDVPLQTVWYSPHRPPFASSHEGLLGGSYQWQCYPSVSQSFKGNKKELVLNVEILGVQRFTYAPITFSIDGDLVSLQPLIWDYGVGLAGGVVDVRVFGQRQLIRRIGSAKEVWLTVFADERHSVRLSSKQLAVFEPVLDRYDSLDPR